jgi:hypothetical protein
MSQDGSISNTHYDTASFAVTNHPVDPALAEIAKMNLLRIRGDMDGAKSLGLSILKKHPRSVEAHVLMGDLNSEQGKLDQAAEWYSLALDIDGKSPGTAKKLEKVRVALDVVKNSSSSQANLAPTKRSGTLLFLAVGASALAIGSMAFLAGTRSPTTPARDTFIREKISMPSQPIRANTNLALESSAVSIPNSRPAEADRFDVTSLKSNPKPPIGSAQMGTSPTAVEDLTLYDQIYSRAKYSKNLTSVLNDPRSATIILSYNVKPGEPGRYIGAMLAAEALQYDVKSESVLLRGSRDGVLSYIADFPRGKMIETEAKYGGLQLLEDHCWIDEILSNEYYKNRITGTPKS